MPLRRTAALTSRAHVGPVSHSPPHPGLRRSTASEPAAAAHGSRRCADGLSQPDRLPRRLTPWMLQCPRVLAAPRRGSVTVRGGGTAGLVFLRAGNAAVPDGQPQRTHPSGHRQRGRSGGHLTATVAEADGRAASESPRHRRTEPAEPRITQPVAVAAAVRRTCGSHDHHSRRQPEAATPSSSLWPRCPEFRKGGRSHRRRRRKTNGRERRTRSRPASRRSDA